MQTLVKHVKTDHEKDDGYLREVCHLCGDSFHKYALKVHMINKHEAGSKDYKCDHCGKEFAAKKILKSHIKCVHEGERNNKCEICGKSFFATSDKQRHIDSVHLKKPDVWKRKKK